MNPILKGPEGCDRLGAEARYNAYNRNFKDGLHFFDLQADANLPRVLDELTGMPFEAESQEFQDQIKRLASRRIDALVHFVSLIHYRAAHRHFRSHRLVRYNDGADHLWILISDQESHVHLDSALEKDP